MKIELSNHLGIHKLVRVGVNEEVIKHCIEHSRVLKDDMWNGALKAMARVPPTGLTLKVVYRQESETIKVITAYLLD
jgi:hypothetical protein